MSMITDKQSVVLFDGVCNLCNGFVLFVIDRDPAGRFAFASLQSTAGDGVLQSVGEPESRLDSVILVENGRQYSRSTAALRILRRLSGGWPLLYGFIIVPRPLRDAVYDFIARRRYSWFGRADSCRIPTPELASRFLPERTTR